MKGKHAVVNDLEEARSKIQQILLEYNCILFSADEWSNVLIEDRDTKQTLNINGK